MTETQAKVYSLDEFHEIIRAFDGTNVHYKLK